VVAVPYSKGTTFGDEDIHELASILADNPFTGQVPGPTNSNSINKHSTTSVEASADTAAAAAAVAAAALEEAEREAAAAVPRLPKTVSMFATRACRSSVMIGTALDRTAMNRIVKRLQGIDQPWNCPHGRPTMRHLVDITPLAVAACED
jgi:DNA mismatch repair protein PMS2